MPQLFRDKIDTAVWLFDALQSEGQFLRLTIQEATNSLVVAYKDAPSNVLKSLESLLLKSFKVEQSEVRFCAIRWATLLFDMQHCPSRFICMLGAADPKLDIREIALEGLCLDEDQRKAVSQNSNLHYPKLSDMLNYIIAQHPAVLHSTSVGETTLLFPSKSYIAMIKFLLKCFVAEEKEYDLPEDFEYPCSVDRFCLLLEHAMAYEGSVELHANASNALITIASSIPQVIATRYADKVSWLKKYLGHIDFDTRESISRLLGIASCSLPLDTLSNLVQDLISSVSAAPKLRFEMEHGLLCALGYITANCMSRTPCIPESLLQSVLRCLTDVVNLETPSLASIAMQALGHVGLSVRLPPLLDGSNSGVLLCIMYLENA
nr:proteasome-associated protein ECM29 homolog isoform X1 [Ipomoea batatas]